MISEKQAYEWVKTGHWSLSKFREWVDELNKQELQELVKEFFEKYLNRVEESDGGVMFSPITINCSRVMMIQPLNDLLIKMAELAGAEVRMNT